MAVHEIDPSATSPEAVVLVIGVVGVVLPWVRYPGWSSQAWNSAPARPSVALPVPITFPDKTSGFNGIAVYDLKV